MNVFDVKSEPGRSRGIAEAVSALSAGYLVGIPTETVYGLAADASQRQAVARIYSAKNRPASNPLIVHVSDLSMAQRQAEFSPLALKLAEAFWPGPLTLVLPVSRTSSLCDLVTAGVRTVGLRVPDHPVTLNLIERFGGPIAAPSANLSGYVSSTSAGDVISDLGSEVAVLLDHGQTLIGIESTILYCLDDEISLLRPGAITRKDLDEVLIRQIAVKTDLHKCPDGILSPGMMSVHYAPRAVLRLHADSCHIGEGMLDFAGQCQSMQSVARAYKDLSPSGDIKEAAANLFQYLRILDRDDLTGIAVASIPSCGIGEAINDRLKRAAHTP